MEETIAYIIQRRREIQARGRQIDHMLEQGLPVDVDELRAMLYEVQEMKRALESILWLKRVMAGMDPQPPVT